MTTYKIIKDSQNVDACIFRDGKDSIPFDPANTDYAKFKIDVAEGSELQDSEGVVMSPEAAQAFIATLP